MTTIPDDDDNDDVQARPAVQLNLVSYGQALSNLKAAL